MNETYNKLRQRISPLKHRDYKKFGEEAESRIEKYVTARSESLQKSLDFAKNDKALLNTLLKLAKNKDIKCQPNVNKSSILYYDRYIKADNLSSEKVDSIRARQKHKFKIQSQRNKSYDLTINKLPIVFPKENPKLNFHTRHNSSIKNPLIKTSAKPLIRIRKKQESLHKDSSESSLHSACIFKCFL